MLSTYPGIYSRLRIAMKLIIDHFVGGFFPYVFRI